jgi:2,3-bisphosphoglycerate-independent phosphoglycerate mutase
VGLPPGQMGNSEVGHLNFGAGRIAMMDISRIDVAVADGTSASNPVIAEALAARRPRGGALHLLGLVSDGGVHSILDHLSPSSTPRRPRASRWWCTRSSTGATRPRAAPEVPRAPRERLEGKRRHRHPVGPLLGHGPRPALGARREGLRAIVVAAEGTVRDLASRPSRRAYAAGQDDEFVEPRALGATRAWPGRDAALFFNFRPDRAREITGALTAKDFDAASTARAARVRALRVHDLVRPALGCPWPTPRRRTPTSSPR